MRFVKFVDSWLLEVRLIFPIIYSLVKLDKVEIKSQKLYLLLCLFSTFKFHISDHYVKLGFHCSLQISIPTKVNFILVLNIAKMEEQMSYTAFFRANWSGVHVAHCLCLNVIGVLVFSSTSYIKSIPYPILPVYPSLSTKIKNAENHSTFPRNISWVCPGL